MANIRQNLVDSTQKFTYIWQNVLQDYDHSEELYRYAHQVLETVKIYMESSSSEAESAVLTLGKTGWGKSTVVNFLDGVQLIPNQRGNLVVSPDNTKPIKTQIADGESNNSTTMAPRFCQTVFGNVCDLPGDQDTAGPLAEIINSIAKKNIGKKLRRIKIVLVIPDSVLGPEGNYGRGLKDILEANDKFLNGINRFKNNMMIIISFSPRKTNLAAVYKKINSCLNHQDGVLKKFKLLINEVMDNNRVKLFAKPSEQQQFYSIPAGENWKDHSRQSIVRQILQLPSLECQTSDFNVPESNKMALMLQKMTKVLVEKMKNQIEAHFDQVVLSGIQLNFAKMIFTELKKKMTIQNFLSLYDQTSFLMNKKPDISQQHDEIKFLNQFLTGNPDEEVKENWISHRLDTKINRIVDSIQVVGAERGGCFRFQFDNQYLKIRPNSPQFHQIHLEFENLKNIEIQKQRIEINRRNNESEFYDRVMEKVFDKTIVVPLQFQQKYVDYQSEQKIVQVPKNVEYDMPIQRETIKFKDETERYKQMVPKVRTITKTMNIPITTYGGRRYVLFGPKEKSTSNINFSYDTQQIYFEQEQKTRQVSKPYTEEYTDYIKGNRVEFEERKQVQNVAVEKERKKVVQVDKDVYKEEQMKKFNEERFVQTDADVERNISGQRTVIQTMITQASHGLDQQIDIPQENLIQTQIEENYKDLLLKWRQLEYKSFAKQHPHKSLEV